MARRNSNPFTLEEIEDIKKYYWIDCEWLHSPQPADSKDSYYNSRVCPNHGIRHRKLPDAETLAMLVLMYPDKTMQDWGDVYNATREAVRIVYNKATGGAFGQDRLDSIYGTKPDMELLKKVFAELKEKYMSKPEVIYDYNLTSENYITYWARRYEEIDNMYQKAKKVRARNKLFRPERKCVRCHTMVKREDFPKSNVHTSGIGNTCNECNRESVKAAYIKRQENYDPENTWSEKKCSSCKEIKPRTYFGTATGMSGGLQSSCNPCMTKFHRKSPARRKKFQDVGLDVNKVCSSCHEMKDYWDFYLIKKNPYSKETGSHATESCRHCVKKAMVTLTNETSMAKFTSKWRGEHKVINDKLVGINPFDYALAYHRQTTQKELLSKNIGENNE